MSSERFFITYFQDRSFVVFDAFDGELAREYADFKAGQIGTTVVGLSEITSGKARELDINKRQEVGKHG